MMLGLQAAAELVTGLCDALCLILTTTNIKCWGWRDSGSQVLALHTPDLGSIPNIPEKRQE